MASRTNSASRLLHLVKPLLNKGDEEVLRIWAEAFGVYGQSEKAEFGVEVVDSLRLVHQEIEHIRAYMTSQTDFSPHLYEKALTALAKVTMVQTLHLPWSRRKGLLSDAVLLALNWCSEILPDDPEQISEQDLAEIHKKVEDLEAALQGSDLPSAVRILITRHLAIIRRALRNDKIVGKKAFRQAMYEGHADIMDNAEVIVANETRPEMTILRTTWSKIKAVSGVIWEIEKVRGAGQKVLEWFNDLKETLP